MQAEAAQEPVGHGPARSVSAVLVAAAGSTVLFWLVGSSLPWGADLQVLLLLITFGVFLAVAVGYSWTVDRVWRRANREATDAMLAFKGDFVANVSHELRTSLTGIVGFAQLVDPEVLGGDNAEAIHAVIGQSAELSRVVDDLTAVARIDADLLEVQVRALPLRNEVEAAVGFVRLMGAEVTIECQDARVMIDQDRFRHVLRNLLVNAHRHGRPGLAVRGQAFGGRYICQVVDQGPGVVPEAEEELFARFRHAGDGHRVPGSMGLGLAVAHELAQQMGCVLSYRRLRGETHFILTIPLAPVADEESAPRFMPGFPVPRLARTHRHDIEGEECVACNRPCA